MRIRPESNGPRLQPDVAVPPVSIFRQTRNGAANDQHLLVKHLHRLRGEAPLPQLRPLAVCSDEEIKLADLAIAQTDFHGALVVLDHLLDCGAKYVVDILTLIASLVQDLGQIAAKDLILRRRINRRTVLERI